MEPGKLDRRIRFDRKVVSQNSFGEEVVTWVPFATVWAARRNLRGVEKWTAQQVASEIVSRYVIRFREDLNPTMRLVDGSREYDIHQLYPTDERRHWLIVEASTRAEGTE
jgi:SPP1 family predicted phage head-tail adaptor